MGHLSEQSIICKKYGSLITLKILSIKYFYFNINS